MARLVLVFNLILERWRCFLSQSRKNVKQTIAVLDHYRHSFRFMFQLLSFACPFKFFGVTLLLTQLFLLLCCAPINQTTLREKIYRNNMSLDKELTHCKNSLPLFPRAMGKNLQSTKNWACQRGLTLIFT